jgi:hypothetical protein
MFPSAYNAEKIRCYEDTMDALHSKGSVGMSAILKACLSTLNGKKEARMEMANFWRAIFPRIGDNNHFVTLCTSGAKNIWVATGKAGWRRWKIDTPSADLQFNVADMYRIWRRGGLGEAMLGSV